MICDCLLVVYTACCVAGVVVLNLVGVVVKLGVFCLLYLMRAVFRLFV